MIRRHSFRSLSHDWSIASSKASYPQIAIWCFRVQFPTSSYFLEVIQYLPTSSSLLPVTYISPIFPTIMCFRRQFLRKMLPIQLGFLLFIVCRISPSSLTLCNTSSFLTLSVQLIFSILLQHHISKLFQVFLIYFAKCPGFSNIQCYAPNAALHYFLP